MTLHAIDWLVVAAYLATVLVIGLVLVRRQAGAEGYFLAGRQLRWPFIGASMFASSISAEHFVGLAGSGFAVGVAMGGFEWMAVYCIVPLVVLFLPFMAHPLLRPWLHGAFVAFLVCMAALAALSLAAAPPPAERLATTTLGGMRALPADPLEGHGQGVRDYRLWLGLVLAITTALFYVMR